MRRIYVADFGAGNTCMYWITPDGEIKDPSDLIDPRGEPSGYALRNDGTVELGRSLYGLQVEDLESYDKIRINLKAQPTEENQKELVFYFEQWLKKIKRERKQAFEGVDKAYWLIGCPTGDAWKEKSTRESYKHMFELAGFENVFIIPESNAAMAYYQKKDHIMDNLRQGAQLLLLDQGAYSLDATYYRGGEIRSFGSYLGAGLIERMIVRKILYEDEEQIRMKRTMINVPDTVAAVRERYERDGVGSSFHTYLLLRARVLKETYYNNLRDGTLRTGKDLHDPQRPTIEINDDEFNLFTNSSVMEDILERRSVKQILGTEFASLAHEVQNELGDSSWMGAFRQYLGELVKNFPELGSGKNVVILLTGGGSQMYCIEEAVRKYFPYADVHFDSNAISAIGKGMAVWGPDKIKAMDFKEAFEAFANREIVDEDGDEISVIAKKLSDVFHECGQNIANEIVSEEVAAVMYGIQQWAEYNCVNTDIPSKIDRHFRDWSKNKGLPNYNSDIREHIDALKEELNKEFYQVMDDFGLKRDALLKADDQVFLSDSSAMMPKLFNNIIDVIVSHYRENEIWSSFDNRRQGLFSNPRQSFLSGAADALQEWVDKETDGTVDLISNAFYHVEFEVGEDKCTFIQLFLYEGFIDLYNLMEKHIKELLGKLVLEEYLSED